jgi:hypothetical protein
LAAQWSRYLNHASAVVHIGFKGSPTCAGVLYILRTCCVFNQRSDRPSFSRVWPSGILGRRGDHYEDCRNRWWRRSAAWSRRCSAAQRSAVLRSSWRGPSSIFQMTPRSDGLMHRNKIASRRTRETRGSGRRNDSRSNKETIRRKGMTLMGRDPPPRSARAA